MVLCGMHSPSHDGYASAGNRPPYGVIEETIAIMTQTGNIRKMTVSMESPAVQYHLPIGENEVAMNQHLGKAISLHHGGDIHCIACGRKTSKSFNQGYCFPCVRSLAQCDSCIVRPEKCHYHEGTCREPEWGERHCMQDHYVYLANSSSVKVGITRGTQIPTRWIDQGAYQALALIRTKNRYISGLVEVALKQHVSDKTNWRKMLQGQPQPVDLQQHGQPLLEKVGNQLAALRDQFGEDAVVVLSDQQQVTINYPVDRYPEKIVSHNFDKNPEVSGILLGIKGQYLMLDSGVLNMRKFAGYQLTLTTE